MGISLDSLLVYAWNWGRLTEDRILLSLYCQTQKPVLGNELFDRPLPRYFTWPGSARRKVICLSKDVLTILNSILLDAEG